MDGTVETRTGDGSATIEWSNPTKHNALTRRMWSMIKESVESLDRNSQVRVIALQGRGISAFSAGGDLSDVIEGEDFEAAREEMNQLGEAAYDAIARCSKPVLALIRGTCMGGGLGLAAACDLRVCATEARFRMPAARLGLGYPTSGVRRYVSLIGPQNTIDMFCTARTFDAAEALRFGLVSRIYDAASFETEVDALIDMIARNAPLSLRALKLSVNQALAMPGLSHEAVQAAIDACNSSQDLLEGAAAFRERRTPSFHGI